MKIAISINTSWNIFNFRLGLIKTLQKNGHRVVAVAPGDPYVNLLENEGVECFPISLNSKGTSAIEDLKLVNSYYKAFKKIKPDVILSYTIKPNIYGNYAAKILGIPVINNVSGLGTVFINKNLATLIVSALYRTAFRNSNWIFFQNAEDQNLFHKKKLVNKTKTSLIPGSGVNLEKFKLNRTKNKGKKVLFVGRLIGDKGIREFIEAGKILHQKYPDVKFNMVGEFGYNNKTAVTKEEFDAWLSLPQFHYLGKVDNMQEVLTDADIMVLPSYREGLSKSLIEACAMKLPIVTTNVPGCREVVENGINGLLCQARNSNDLALKIKDIIEISEENRLQMGESSRKIAIEKFDEKIVIQEYLDRIRTLSLN